MQCIYLRALQVASKKVDARGLSTLAREDAEAGLSLVALLLFRNEPKSDSAAAIAELRLGGVECVMVRPSASERRGNSLTHFTDFLPECQDQILFLARTRVWS